MYTTYTSKNQSITLLKGYGVSLIRKAVLVFAFVGIALCGFGETIKGDLIITTNRTVEGELIVIGNLTIKSGVTLTIKSGAVVTVSGDVTNNGTLTIQDDQTGEDAYSHLNALKNFTNKGTVNLSGGSLVVGSLANEKLVEGTGNMYLNDGFVKFYVDNSFLLVRNDLIQQQKSSISVKTGLKNCSLVVQNQYMDYFGTPPAQNFNRNPWYIDMSEKSQNGKVEAVKFISAVDGFLHVNHYLPNGQDDKDVKKSYLEYVLGLKNNETTNNGKLEEYIKELIKEGVDKKMIEEIIEEIGELLPIELTYFTAHESENAVVFDWQTASEINNDFFTVEYSLDGIQFNECAFENGNGTTSETHNYSVLVSLDSFYGVTYFRLKQTDFNGEYSYSNVILLDIDSNPSITLYPNPAVDRITINGEFEQAFFSNVYGRTVAVQQGSDKTFNVSTLPSGLYYVTVVTKRGKQVISFVKD